MSTSYAVIDTETTGLTADARIIQIAAVLLDPHGRVEGSWSTLVNPELDHIGASQVHRLTAQQLQSAPTFPQVLETIQQVIGDRTIVGHNVTFDLTMLNAEYLRAGTPAHTGQTVCTYRLAREVLPGAVNHRLATACADMGIRLDHAHDALADASAAAALFVALNRRRRSWRWRAHRWVTAARQRFLRPAGQLTQA